MPFLFGVIDQMHCGQLTAGIRFIRQTTEVARPAGDRRSEGHPEASLDRCERLVHMTSDRRRIAEDRTPANPCVGLKYLAISAELAQSTAPVRGRDTLVR